MRCASTSQCRTSYTMPNYTLFLFLSCSTDTDSSFVYPSSPAQTEDTDIESSEPSSIIPEEHDAPCSDGFVPIPTENPMYCIMTCEAQIIQTEPHSQVGQSPSSNISYYDAQDYCASIDHSTPMRLPTVMEWRDAGDGVIGEGGTDYPWGNDVHAGECVLPHEDTTWDYHQTCGYLSSCVSVFGVYDQIGNLWEWAESGLYVDIEAWMNNQDEQGHSFMSIDGILHTGDNTLHGFHPFVIGLSQSTIDIVDGMIWVRVSEPFRNDLPGVGYFKSSEMEIPSSLHFLPISLAWDEQRKNAQIIVETGRDGEPIPAKVGGSFYSGADTRLDTIFWGHVPEFDGSIGFRCIYDVYPQ